MLSPFFEQEGEKMKLLEKEELKGIDSTKATIEKWDEFLKKAVWNLGYRQETIDNMYPYERGIPVLGDGERIPVDPVTGRRFFKMSDADKIAIILSTITQKLTNNSFLDIMKDFFEETINKDKEKYLNYFFPDATEEEMETLKNYKIRDAISVLRSKPANSPIWEALIKRSDIFVSSVASRWMNMRSKETHQGYLSEKDKNELLKGDTLGFEKQDNTGMMAYFFIKTLEDKFTNIPDKFCEDFLDVLNDYNKYEMSDRLRYFKEVYLQDYLVVSLNPIDKLMCSTKQAFSSCMSIAKQDSVTGTQSRPAFGLPSLFDTDGVFMIFTTPGKHKNMYWESDEWIKVPAERNKEKAYKYLKMTCRCLTYQGVPTKPEKSTDWTPDWSNTSIEIMNMYDRCMDLSKERLYVGRMYSANGEDFGWQVFAEVVLARAGVATALAYSDKALEFLTDPVFAQEMKTRSGLSPVNVSGYLRSILYDILRTGRMKAKPPITTDRYGFLRPIYYDNVRFEFKDWVIENTYNLNNSGISMEYDTPLVNSTFIKVGSSRMGSCGIVSYNQDSKLDMFRMMLGLQKYTMFNTQVKICRECGKIITHDYDNKQVVLEDGTTEYVCDDCVEICGYVHCPVCDKLHAKDDPLHEILDLGEIFEKPELKSKKACRYYLNQVRDDGLSNMALCLHCLKPKHKYSEMASAPIQHLEWENHRYAVGIDTTCAKKAVVCDKCKRIVFLEEGHEPCLLLSKRKVICPDCINDIRMKKEKKNFFKFLVAHLTRNDIKGGEEDVDNILAEILKTYNKVAPWSVEPTITKSFEKQVRSIYGATGHVPEIKVLEKLLDTEVHESPAEDTNEQVDSTTEDSGVLRGRDTESGSNGLPVLVATNDMEVPY